MSPVTTANLCSYMREVCSAIVYTRKNVIDGINCTVEVDESLFSTRKNNVGRSLPEIWVVGAYFRFLFFLSFIYINKNRETKQVWIEAVSDRKGPTLMNLIRRKIAPQTRIITGFYFFNVNYLTRFYRHVERI